MSQEITVQQVIDRLRAQGYKTEYHRKTIHIQLPPWLAYANRLAKDKVSPVYAYLHTTPGRVHLAYTLQFFGHSSSNKLRYSYAEADFHCLLTEVATIFQNYEQTCAFATDLPSLLPATTHIQAQEGSQALPDWVYGNPAQAPFECHGKPCWPMQVAGLSVRLYVGLHGDISIEAKQTSLSGARLKAMAAFYRAITSVAPLSKAPQPTLPPAPAIVPIQAPVCPDNSLVTASGQVYATASI